MVDYLTTRPLLVNDLNSCLSLVKTLDTHLSLVTCLLGFDLPDLRQKLFGASAVGFLMAAIFDGLVWRGVERLEIY